jgi:glyoxylase-like metal-dependent hydrolase (beta-lactamase superfamily II)
MDFMVPGATGAHNDSAATAGKPRGTRRAFLTTAAATVSTVALAGTAHATSQPDGGALPDYAPIPTSAFGPSLNELGYHVGRVRGNLYWVTDSTYQAMFLSTRTGVVLVDAPPSIGHNLLRAIEEVTRANGRPGKVTHLIYSHYHADHIGAARIFGNKVARIAHAETDRMLRAARDANRPRPTTTFRDRYTLKVGGERLELAHHGPNHTPDNIFVYAPDHQTLCVVDVVVPGWVPYRNLEWSQEIPRWIKANEQVMHYPWTAFIGGHTGRLGTRADAELQMDYLDDLATHARATIEDFDVTPYFEKYGPSGNAYAAVKHYMDDAARQVAEPVIAKYTGKLAAVDVFTTDNAFTMLQSLQTDTGLSFGGSGIRP